MNKKIKLINIIQLFFILVYIPVVYSEKLNTAVIILKVIFSIYGITKIIKIDKKYTFLILLFLGFCFANCIPMIIEKQVKLRNIIIEMYPFGIYCLIIYYATRNLKEFIEQGYKASVILVFLALFMAAINLLSNKQIFPVLQINRNAMQIYLTFIIGFILLKNFYKTNKVIAKDKILLIISFLLIILSTSATGTIAAFIGIILILLNRKINIKIITSIFITIFIIIVVLQNTNILNLNYIFDIFNKSTTFSSRTWRWNYSISQFKENFLFGRYNILSKVSDYANYELDNFNPHNGILNITTYSGATGLLLFITIIAQFHKAYKNINNKIPYLIVYSMTLISSLMESCLSNNSFTIYTFIILCIIEYKESNRNKEVGYEKDN